jgi:hypothetical protein
MVSLMVGALRGVVNRKSLRGGLDGPAADAHILRPAPAPAVGPLGSQEPAR